jgi:plastocyanin
MEKNPQTQAYWVVGILILVVIITLSIGNNSPKSETRDTATTTSELTKIKAEAPKAAPITSAVPIKTSTPIPAPTPALLPVVSLVTPAATDIWNIGAGHEINWNYAPNATAGLELLDNAEKPIGWIQSSIGSGQTTFTWNTRDVTTSRFGATSKNVEPGTYKIRLPLDGRADSIISAPFTLSAGGQESVTRVVRLEHDLFSPRSLVVQAGEEVALINSESITHIITSSTNGFEPITLRRGEIRVINTNSLSKGIYTLISNVYSYRATGNLEIK